MDSFVSETDQPEACANGHRADDAEPSAKRWRHRWVHANKPTTPATVRFREMAGGHVASLCGECATEFVTSGDWTMEPVA